MKEATKLYCTVENKDIMDLWLYFWAIQALNKNTCQSSFDKILLFTIIIFRGVDLASGLYRAMVQYKRNEVCTVGKPMSYS